MGKGNLSDLVGLLLSLRYPTVAIAKGHLVMSDPYPKMVSTLDNIATVFLRTCYIAFNVVTKLL